MRALVRRLFNQLDREDINWEQHSVAFEFLAISCLLNVATTRGWRARCTSLPGGIRMDSWNKFPAHSFGRFGRRTRRSSVESLSGALTPKIFLNDPLNQTISVYYQGFPPLDVPGERPDWIIIPSKASVSSENDKVCLRLESSKGSWQGTYETLLGPYGPPKRFETGTMPKPLGIIEVSLAKSGPHLNRQIFRYKGVYGATRYFAFLACEAKGTNFPGATIDLNVKNELAFRECVSAGENICDLFFS
jgi:hypothetical protein